MVTSYQNEIKLVPVFRIKDVSKKLCTVVWSWKLNWKRKDFSRDKKLSDANHLNYFYQNARDKNPMCHDLIRPSDWSHPELQAGHIW